MTAASWIAVLAAYALGSLLGGKLFGALKGVDLSQSGSGNIGATNALRTQGPAFGLAVLAFDVGKGVIATVLLPHLAAVDAPVWLPLACGAAAATGHCYPLWHRLRGGKGVATLAGVFAAALPASFPWMIAAFALVLMLSGIVSLATLAGGIAALLQVVFWSSAGLWSPAGAFTLTMLALVLFKHRSNWGRLWRGEEPRFEKARLLGRVLGLK